MRNDSELTLLLVFVISGMCWFVIRFFWLVGESIVRAVKASFPHDEHPIDWHGQAPPVCRRAGTTCAARRSTAPSAAPSSTRSTVPSSAT